VFTNKKGFILQGGTLLVVIVIGVIGFMIYNGSINVDAGSTTASLTDSRSSSSSTGAVCNKEDATVTLSGEDVFDSSISIAGDHRYNDGGGWTVLADGGSFTADPEATVMVAFGDGNNTAGEKVFTVLVTERLDCTGAKTISGDAYRSGGMTMRAFNLANSLIDLTAEDQNAGDVDVFSGDISGAFERAPAPYGGVVVCEYNSTTHDTCEVSFDGRSAVKGVTPTFFSVSNVDMATKSWEFPSVISSPKIDMDILVDADDTTAPTAGAFAAGSDIRLHFYPADYFLNTATDTFELAVEDQDGVELSNNPVYLYNVTLD